jgi:hypothetical protein
VAKSPLPKIPANKITSVCGSSETLCQERSTEAQKTFQKSGIVDPSIKIWPYFPFGFILSKLWHKLSYKNNKLTLAIYNMWRLSSTYVEELSSRWDYDDKTR